jgi:hypothetical protein
VVTLVIAVVKFTHGAWFIIVLVPALVAVLVRLKQQYEREASELQAEVDQAATAKVHRRHVVLLMVERLDRAAARGILYARALSPDELRAVHVAVDPVAADELMDAWLELGLTRFPLELVECPDRRLVQALSTVVVECLADGRTEVTVLVPRREYRHLWHRLLHDRTGDDIARGVSRLHHANVTFVPYHLGTDAAPVATTGSGS